MAIYIPTGRAIEDREDSDRNDSAIEGGSQPDKHAGDEAFPAIFLDCGRN